MIPSAVLAGCQTWYCPAGGDNPSVCWSVLLRSFLQINTDVLHLGLKHFTA